ncbi:hypothetical protein ACFL5O_10155, partial [Myxococcota bacterium]
VPELAAFGGEAAAAVDGLAPGRRAAFDKEEGSEGTVSAWLVGSATAATPAGDFDGDTALDGPGFGSGDEGTAGREPVPVSERGGAEVEPLRGGADSRALATSAVKRVVGRCSATPPSKLPADAPDGGELGLFGGADWVVRAGRGTPGRGGRGSGFPDEFRLSDGNSDASRRSADSSDRSSLSDGDAQGA